VKQARIGCSGWAYDDWRGRFYRAGEPRRRWLELYAERFDTVEVNNTFYRLPKVEAVRSWAEQTPAGFCFAVKASRYLTHIRRLTDTAEGMKRFYERIEPLQSSGKLGPLLWQLPENFHRDDERLEGWLNALPAGRHTIEFRHASWFAAPVLRALRDHDVALTIGDHPDRPFQSHAATASWRFIRWHFGARGRNGNYSQTELDTWARRITAWRRSTEVYAYFNNDWSGFAPANALWIKRRLSV
jgi:uncharacterized protein YecE (DUF72 family)